MDGKIVVITGASDGIGAAAARALHRLGATVVPVGRSPDKTAQIGAEVGTEPLVADFSQLESVRQLAGELGRRYSHIDVLANNAGGTWPSRQLTEDGHELTFQVNHLAPFLLTHLLRDRMAGGRVIVTSSGAHHTGHVRLDDLDSARWYLPYSVYGTTKLENILFAAELARRWAGDGITATSFHPGVVATQFGRDNGIIRRLYHLTQPLMKTPAQGADTLVWLATAPPSDWRNGGYHLNRKASRIWGQAVDTTLASGLWQRSSQMLGLHAEIA
jgi:NAD(P)-dependent dehydrogenase (short-subunit alcohol dehydrogenase family)